MTDDDSNSYVPLSLKSAGDSLEIEWADHVVHTLSWSLLRKMCPCASCRIDREKPPQPASLLPVISPSEAEPLKPVEMRAVGNYAYAIHFNDGHNSGIYTLEFLRQLGEQSGN